eukprot:Platyproteum_vivax@DN6044_c0_g1_i1.p1
MSYGALSDNAILALNTAASMGDFYHNTGEGGISRFHLKPGGDLVWNIGTGYFGCRDDYGKFSPEKFRETANKHPQVKMIELKISQGAKPGHGGLLPGEKVTSEIAFARGIPVGVTCVSPPHHSKFSNFDELLDFVAELRELSNGKPIGIKMCVGQPDHVRTLGEHMKKKGVCPDFITVDGGEGGTGAAPPEFSNNVGFPLIEGLRIVNDMLIENKLREHVKIIVAGKVTSGFQLCRMLALGADVCNAARAMMFALGCIQALKCNTNKCPTGVATNNPILMFGLDVPDKATRVYNYQKKTVQVALELMGAVGCKHPADLKPHHLYKRVSICEVKNYEELYRDTKRKQSV